MVYLAFDFAARSDVGLVRSVNQDSAFAGPQLLVVADGMGGAAGGDIASSIAVATLASLDGEAIGQDDSISELKRGIADAHTEIVGRAHNDPELSGLGTTVTAVLRSGNTVAMAHIGDSRAYLLRDEVLDQLTTDHSFVQHLVDTGRLSAADAEHHPRRSMLLRVLGDIDADVPVDISAREIKAGDRWLLCSDGLSSIVSRATLAATLSSVPDPAECADRLVGLAMAGGAPDNITVIIANVVDIDATPRTRAPSTAPQVVGAAAFIEEPAPSTSRPSTKASGPSKPSKTSETPSLPKTASPTVTPPLKPSQKAQALTPLPLPKGGPSRPLVRVWERLRPWALPVVGFLALFAASFGAYAWSQQQYYVGAHDGQVAIYRGIPQNLGPFSFSSLVQDTGISLEDLPPYEATRIEATIRTSSIDGAWTVVDGLEVTP